jgi:DNA-binding HxlR family transcriptional regulator
MTKSQSATSKCPVEPVLRLLSGRWTLTIMWRLHTEGPQRFGALGKLIPGVSAKVLTERLRLLEDAGLVHRHMKPTIPPEVTYSLTQHGDELRASLSEIERVAYNWQSQGWGPAVEA